MILNQHLLAGAEGTLILSSRIVAQVKVPSGDCLYYHTGERIEDRENSDMATRVKVPKDTESPSERFERVMRKAKERGQRARARRVEQLYRTDAKSTRRSPEGAS